MNAGTWMLRLARLAPVDHLSLVRVLAHFLAGPASSDAVLLVADALSEVAREHQAGDRDEYARLAREMADVVRAEAPKRKEIPRV